MDGSSEHDARLEVRGGRRLEGEVVLSGAKNSALKLLAASLLTTDTCVIRRVPRITDVATMVTMLRALGADVGGEGDQLRVRAGAGLSGCAPYELVRTMRASIIVMGPLVARLGEATIAMPGGCNIGPRRIDFHIRGLEKLGAQIDIDHGFIRVHSAGLKGAVVPLDYPSVGATENLLMAACLAKGETRLINAAREPEVIDLGDCLIKMGAEIEGLGSDKITIRGVERLHGAEHAVVADRIETGTYAMAAAITDGEIDLIGGRADHLSAVIKVLEAAGISVQKTNRGLKVKRANGQLRGVDVMTEPYPGFPTDLQAQTMALMSTAEGAAMITESIFENRFMHVPELVRMGANVNVHGSSAMVRGQPRLTGAEVMATDLRASVSLVLAGLAAEGETVLNRVYHLDRGYERLEQKLAACGAAITRRRAPE